MTNNANYNDNSNYNRITITIITLKIVVRTTALIPKEHIDDNTS